MGDIRFYKGKHKVKVVTESIGYLTVEALEDFEDLVDDERVTVKKGERRIVPVADVHKKKTFPSMLKEHAYELDLEKKLKRLVAEEETKEGKKKTKT